MKICIKYSSFSNIFFLYFVIKLPEHIRINNYFINLLDNKQSLYNSIYTLKLVKLEMLKTYIKTNLANDSIKYSKFLHNIVISFV